jgi:hypothetical protein
MGKFQQRGILLVVMLLNICVNLISAIQYFIFKIAPILKC